MPAFRILSRGAVRRMSSRTTPRSATDATRFTSTTPQPKSKTSAPAGKGAPAGETLEQRVQRLRAAHLAARSAPLSTADRVTETGRKVFDALHKVTLIGLIGFTVVAGVFSVYAVMDMLRFNRKRREEFMEAQKKIESDAFQSARLAFINGTATDEQARLVEEAIQDAERTGTKLPPLLSGPGGAEADKVTVAGDVSLWEKVDAQVKAEGGSVAKAQGVMERERENQRRGGPLDKLGLETEGKAEGSGKRWWWPW